MSISKKKSGAFFAPALAFFLGNAGFTGFLLHKSPWSKETLYRNNLYAGFLFGFCPKLFQLIRCKLRQIINGRHAETP